MSISQDSFFEENTCGAKEGGKNDENMNNVNRLRFPYSITQLSPEENKELLRDFTG